jgi:TatA/E family protein of Tat protein translocase
MFDVGMPELVVIFTVALLVFGPKKLPELGRTLGKGLGELKKALQDVKDSVQEEFNETTSDIRDAVTDVKSQITKEVQDAGTTIDKTMEQVKSEVKIDEEIKSALKDEPEDTKKEPDSSSNGKEGNAEPGSAKT